ncbi:MAG TPA: hypothetical protein VI603_15870 [Saprospiraceae bacterium]|nr:hypothetical protein [Saprospiraceae bacterium]
MERVRISVLRWLSVCAMLVFHTGTPIAQNVTIDRESAPVKYYRMPDEPLDPSYKTYTTEVVAYSGDLIRSGITVASLESEYLTLEGYAKDQRNGDVHLEATVSDFSVFSETRESRQSKSKDKDGKEIVTTHYWIEVKYALPVSMSVRDRDGHVLDDRFIFTLTDQRSYSTPSYKSTSDLDNYWRINRTRQLAELHKSMLTEAFRKIKEIVNNTFGYRRITNENARFETIGKKKHLEYARYKKAVETIRKGFTLMDPDKSLDAVRKAVEPALTFYQNREKAYSSTDKDLFKLKHICLYNLALAYFWLEDFDKATQYAQAILKLYEKDRDVKRLIEEIDEVKTSLLRADKSSRHMIEVSRS